MATHSSLFGEPGSADAGRPSDPPSILHPAPPGVGAPARAGTAEEDLGPGEFGVAGASDPTVVSPGADRRHLPEKIGRYRIKRMLGFGGMGTVYEAIQDHPRRTVALKVMKPGVASRSSLKRFEYESQVLARLRHPGIAQVYDAGTYSTGEEGSPPTPFFAMEYIPGGQSITDYAKAKHLNVRQRLQLFVRVCDAVHHGHQKGVIHRDLKPANILIDSSGGEAIGQPKVIDFGVARATDHDIAVTTLQTDVGQLIGTLQYMSPEQCAADPADIDTRSDVYALGVILYELLADKLPYDVTGVAVYDATRVVRDQLPARLTTINSHLGGDVETIVFKALEKDRDRRYQSAAELARDINRYLAAEPISARRASVLYLLTVFTKRHKPVVFATVGVFGALVVGIVITAMALARANRETARAQGLLRLAEAEVEQSRAIGGFLAELIQSVDPLNQRFATGGARDSMLAGPGLGKPAREVTIAEALVAASGRIDAIFDGQPLMQAEVRDILGTTLHGVGMYQEALAQLRTAYNLRRAGLGEDHPDTLRSAVNLANSLRMASQTAESNRLFRIGAEGLAKSLGEDHPDVLYARSWIVSYDPREAVASLREILKAAERVYGASHPRTIMIGALLGATLLGSGSPEAAVETEALARAMLARAQEAFGQTRFQTAWCTYLIGAALREQGRSDAAVDFFRLALDLYRRHLGEDHPMTLGVASALAAAYVQVNAHEAAVELARRNVETYRPARPDLVSIGLHQTLADALLAAGAAAEAAERAQVALDIAQGLTGIEAGAATAGAQLTLGRTLTALGRFGDAEPPLQRAYSFYAAAGAGQPAAGAATRGALTALIALYEQWDKPEQLTRTRELLEQLRPSGTR